MKKSLLGVLCLGIALLISGARAHAQTASAEDLVITATTSDVVIAEAVVVGGLDSQGMIEVLDLPVSPRRHIGTIRVAVALRHRGLAAGRCAHQYLGCRCTERHPAGDRCGKLQRQRTRIRRKRRS